MLTEFFQTVENLDIDNAVIGGDFNARTGNITSSPWHLNPDLSQHRISRDNHVCTRGKLFIDGLIHSNLSLLNGHCPSDINGEFTQTEKSQTVIDYVMTGTDVTSSVVDFEVKEISKSDHQPCSVSIHVQGATTCVENIKKTERIERVKWIPQNAAVFKAKLESIAVPNTTSATDLYEILKCSILSAARDANMTYSFKPPRNVSTSQPWIDRECRIQNANVNKSLRHCKKYGFTEDNTKLYLQNKANARLLQKKEGTILC